MVTVFEGDQKQGELISVEVGDLVQGYWVDEIGETTLSLRWGDRPGDTRIDTIGEQDHDFGAGGVLA